MEKGTREVLAAFAILLGIVAFVCVAGLMIAGTIHLGHYWFGG